jgi:hypothetical protein
LGCNMTQQKAEKLETNSHQNSHQNYGGFLSDFNSH